MLCGSPLRLLPVGLLHPDLPRDADHGWGVYLPRLLFACIDQQRAALAVDIHDLAQSLLVPEVAACNHAAQGKARGIDIHELIRRLHALIELEELVEDISRHDHGDRCVLRVEDLLYHIRQSWWKIRAVRDDREADYQILIGGEAVELALDRNIADPRSATVQVGDPTETQRLRSVLLQCADERRG